MKKIQVGLVAVLLNVTAAAQLTAITVFDPANFVENVATALRTLQSNLNEAQQIAHQIASLENEALNLARLPISLRGELVAAVERLEGVIAAARGIAFDYAQIQAAFEAFYPEAAAYADASGAEVAARSAEWAEQTRLAVNDALSAQGLVIEIAADRISLAELMQASNEAEGALSAAQAANEIAGLTVTQLMRLEHIVAGSQRAQTAFLASQASSAHASRAQLNYLGGDWGARGSDDTPSEPVFFSPIQ